MKVRHWIDHRWASRRLPAYVDGELSPRARRRLERHARLCPECGPMRRSLLRTVWMLRTLRQSRRSSVAPKVIGRLRELDDEQAGAPQR